MPCDLEACYRIRDRLWFSGRFIKCDMAVTAIVWREEKARLTLNLMEYKNAPRLSEALSPSEEALLKCGRWLSNQAGWDGDLVVRLTDRNREMVISPERGAMFMLYNPHSVGSRRALDNAIVAAKGGELEVCNVAAGKRLVLPAHNCRVTISLTTKLSDQSKDWEEGKPFCDVWTADAKYARTASVRLIVGGEPAAFLALAREKAQCSIENEIVTVKRTSEVWRIDVTTGRLLECEIHSDGTDTPGVSYLFEKGAFDRRLAQLRTAVAEPTNAFDPGRPFTSVGRLLTDEGTWWPFDVEGSEIFVKGTFLKLVARQIEHRAETTADPRVYPVIRKLLDHGILASMDDVCIEYLRKRNDIHFQLPAKPCPVGNEAIGTAAQFLLFTSEMLFPRNSWPSTVSREATFSSR